MDTPVTSWERKDSGCLEINNSSGRILLDSVSSDIIKFAMWIVLCNSGEGNRDFSILAVSLDALVTHTVVKHNRFSHLSYGSPIHTTYEANLENGNLRLYAVSPEVVSYQVYRFWSNLSYADKLDTTGVVEGNYGGATHTPCFMVDSFGRLVNVHDVLITPAWGDVMGKPTTVALSGLLDALSTSSLIDCGGF